MQYKAISNAVNCFALKLSIIEALFEFLKLGFPIFYAGCRGEGVWSSCKIHPIHFTRLEDGTPFLLLHEVS